MMNTKDLENDLKAENYQMTEQGIYFPKQGILAQGEYFDRINGGEWQTTHNLVVNEGLAHLLNVAMGTTAKPAGYYLALFSGATAPAANWTAATFPSVAQEITSLTEGYADATRPAWAPGVAANGSISNSVAASLTITTATTLSVTGLALLTNNTRGGTSGVLVSATKFASTRSFQNGDVYQIGYKLDLSA